MCHFKCANKDVIIIAPLCSNPIMGVATCLTPTSYCPLTCVTPRGATDTAQTKPGYSHSIHQHLCC